jgi:hypothetical protein
VEREAIKISHVVAPSEEEEEDLLGMETEERGEVKGERGEGKETVRDDVEVGMTKEVSFFEDLF